MRIATMILLACSLYYRGSVAVPAAPAAVAAPIDTVRLKFYAFNQHDVGAIEEIYASSASLHSPDYPNLVGNKPIADTYRRLFDAIPDAKDNLELLEASANHIYAQFVLTGHLKAAQDKPISVRIISVYEVKGAHIVDDSTYYDRKTP
jgi:hypothetical protein